MASQSAKKLEKKVVNNNNGRIKSKNVKLRKNESLVNRDESLCCGNKEEKLTLEEQKAIDNLVAMGKNFQQRAVPMVPSIEYIQSKLQCKDCRNPLEARLIQNLIYCCFVGDFGILNNFEHLKNNIQESNIKTNQNIPTTNKIDFDKPVVPIIKQTVKESKFINTEASIRNVKKNKPVVESKRSNKAKRIKKEDLNLRLPPPETAKSRLRSKKHRDSIDLLEEEDRDKAPSNSVQNAVIEETKVTNRIFEESVADEKNQNIEVVPRSIEEVSQSIEIAQNNIVVEPHIVGLESKNVELESQNNEIVQKNTKVVPQSIESGIFPQAVELVPQNIESRLHPQNIETAIVPYVVKEEVYIEKNNLDKKSTNIKAKIQTTLREKAQDVHFTEITHNVDENKTERTAKSLTCSFCSNAFTSKNGLNYHIKYVHSEEKSKVIKPFTCPFNNCNKKYKNKNGLYYHLTHHHADETEDIEALYAECVGAKKE